jgi:hypothetical protein
MLVFLNYAAECIDASAPHKNTGNCVCIKQNWPDHKPDDGSAKRLRLDSSPSEPLEGIRHQEGWGSAQEEERGSNKKAPAINRGYFCWGSALPNL